MSRTAGLLIVSSLALAGCNAVSTRMVSADSALISASNDEASVPQARKAALVHAAKLARSKGYEYFEVLDARDSEGMTWQYRPLGPIAFDNKFYWNTPISEASQDMTVRFLTTSNLPANGQRVYAVTAVLAER